MNKKRSKVNTKYFDIIPEEVDKNQLLYDKCQAKSRLREQKQILIEETKEYRKKLYNLTIEIESIDQEIDKLMKKVNENGTV